MYDAPVFAAHETGANLHTMYDFVPFSFPGCRCSMPPQSFPTRDCLDLSISVAVMPLHFQGRRCPQLHHIVDMLAFVPPPTSSGLGIIQLVFVTCPNRWASRRDLPRNLGTQFLSLTTTCKSTKRHFWHAFRAMWQSMARNHCTVDCH